MKSPVDLQDVAFSKAPTFSNEVLITTDPTGPGLHRISFLEVGPSGGATLIAAVLITTPVLTRLHEIFGQRIGAKPGILKPEHFISSTH